MAWDWSDPTFVGIDSDLFGDGAAASTQPVDVYAEQRLALNQRWLNVGRRAVARFYRASSAAFDAGGNYSGERPVATISKAGRWIIPVWCDNELEAARFTVFANIGSRLTADAGFVFEGILFDPLMRPIGRVTSVENDTTGFESVQIDVELTRPYQNDAGFGRLVVYVQSRDAGDTTDNLDFDAAADLRLTCDASTPVNNVTPGPVDASPELRYAKDSETPNFFDFFGSDDDDPKGTGQTYLFPDQQLEYTPGGRLGVFDQRFMTYAQFRSASLELRYTAESINPIGQDSLAAKQTVDGPQSIELSQAPGAWRKRPRLLTLLPGDFESVNQQASWPTDYKMFWPVAVGDAADDTIVDESVLVCSDSPVLEVVLYVIATIDVLWQRNERLVKGACDWIFDASLSQFDLSDTDWTTPDDRGSVSHTATVGLFNTGAYRDSRFLRTKAIMHDFAASQGTSFGGTVGVADQAKWQYAYKEGLLFEEDLALITPIRFRVPTSSLTASARPARLTITAQYDDNTAEHEAIPGIDDAATLDEAFHLTLVGGAVFEVAQ